MNPQTTNDKQTSLEAMNTDKLKDAIKELPDGAHVKIYAYYGDRDKYDHATNDLKALLQLVQDYEDMLAAARRVTVRVRPGFDDLLVHDPGDGWRLFAKDDYYPTALLAFKSLQQASGGEGQDGR